MLITETGVQTITVGPPGTGKTTDALNKVMAQVDSKRLHLSEVAFVFFNKSASQDSINRLCEQTGCSDKELKYFSTVHAMAKRYSNLDGPIIITGEDKLMDTFVYEYGVDVRTSNDDVMWRTKANNHSYLLQAYGFAKNRRMAPMEFAKAYPDTRYSPAALDHFTKAYDKFKLGNGAIDFIDMLTVYIEQGRPLTEIKMAIIDEGQDLSVLQYKVLQKAFANCPLVRIYGDDDQTINTWAGASLETFMSLSGERTVLEKSHRVPRKIHAVAQTIIERCAVRIPKNYAPRDEEGEVEIVTDCAFIDINPNKGSWYVLARAGYFLSKVGNALLRKGYPYINNRISSIKPNHLLAIEAWAQLCGDQSISKRMATNLYRYIKLGTGVTPGHDAAWNELDAGEYSYADLAEIGLCADITKPWFKVLDNIALQTMLYYVNVYNQFGYEGLFDVPKIQIGTIHSVKGGEADNVVLFEDTPPAAYLSLDDAEHRIWYVAVTRARKKLYVVRTNSRFSYKVASCSQT